MISLWLHHIKRFLQDNKLIAHLSPPLINFKAGAKHLLKSLRLIKAIKIVKTVLIAIVQMLAFVVHMRGKWILNKFVIKEAMTLDGILIVVNALFNKPQMVIHELKVMKIPELVCFRFQTSSGIFVA